MTTDDVERFFGPPDSVEASVFGTQTPQPWQAMIYKYNMGRDPRYTAIDVPLYNELVFQANTKPPLLDHYDIRKSYADAQVPAFSHAPEPTVAKWTAEYAAGCAAMSEQNADRAKLHFLEAVRQAELAKTSAPETCLALLGLADLALLDGAFPDVHAFAQRACEAAQQLTDEEPSARDDARWFPSSAWHLRGYAYVLTDQPAEAAHAFELAEKLASSLANTSSQVAANAKGLALASAFGLFFMGEPASPPGALGAEPSETAALAEGIGQIIRHALRLAAVEGTRDLASRLPEAGRQYFLGETAIPLLALVKAGRYREAEYLALSRLQVGLSGDRQADAANTDILAGLVDAHVVRGEYSDAESVLEIWARVVESTVGAEALALVQPLRLLGNAYVLSRQRSQAEQPLRRALAIQEKYLGSSHPDLAETLFTLGSVLFTPGKAAEAEPYLTRALGILDKSPSADPLRTARVLSVLAQARQALGKDTEAKQLRQRAYGLCETVKTEASLSLFRDVSQQGGDALDLAIAERELALAESVYGPEHPGVAQSLLSVGTAHSLAGGNLAKAESALRRAIAICDRTETRAPLVLGQALFSLGDCYEKLGRRGEAEVVYKRALDVLEPLTGKGDEFGPDMSFSMTKDAYVRLLQSQGRDAEAAQIEARGTGTPAVPAP